MKRETAEQKARRLWDQMEAHVARNCFGSMPEFKKARADLIRAEREAAAERFDAECLAVYDRTTADLRPAPLVHNEECLRAAILGKRRKAVKECG